MQCVRSSRGMPDETRPHPPPSPGVDMTDAPNTERKVFLLPVELMRRLRAWQSDNDVPSEVEAARRLLHRALCMIDKPEDILARLRAEYDKTHDLRTASGNVLATHPLVTSITFGQGIVGFSMGADATVCLREDGKDVVQRPPPVSAQVRDEVEP